MIITNIFYFANMFKYITTTIFWDNKSIAFCSIKPIVNLIFFITSHYLLGEPGGWKKKDKSPSTFSNIKFFFW